MLVPRDLLEEVRALADMHDRTLSAEIRRALRLHVEREAAEQPATEITRDDLRQAAPAES